MTGPAIGDPARVRIVRLGAEASPVLVIERLLTDPEPLLEAAFGATYGQPRVPAFPGVRAPAPGAYTKLLGRTLTPLLRDAFGLPGQLLMSGASDFSLVTRRPQALTLRQRVPHTDGVDPGLLAVLHYLTPGGCSGTSFYRHRATGVERVTAARRAAYEAQLGRELEHDAPQGYIAGSGPLFERIGGFDGAFNRLIAYRGDLLHSGDVPDDFDYNPDPRHGRLTVNTFFAMRPPPC